MKELKSSDFNLKVINQLTTTLRQGYECEVKYAGERVGIIKIKRKLLYKVSDESEIANYLLPSLIKLINENPTGKIELKKENDKIAIVFVKKQEVK